jgi:DNA-binding transcriptional regulator YdaS (Cro superfamily)
MQQRKPKKTVVPLPGTTAVIEALGGPVKTARALGVKNYQAVQNWRVVPIQYVLLAERLTGISRKAVRPDIWMMVWPDFDAVAI